MIKHNPPPHATMNHGKISDNGGAEGRGGYEQHEHQRHSPLAASAHATLHCLIGCVVGDAVGAALGVTLGLGPWATMGLGTAFAYVAGFALAVIPIMRQMELSLGAAMRVVWLGEVISIAVMEIVMNGVDYAIGGVQTTSIMQPVFWIGLAVAAPASFLAAWPVNCWLLKKEIKAHH